MGSLVDLLNRILQEVKDLVTFCSQEKQEIDQATKIAEQIEAVLEEWKKQIGSGGG